MKKNGLPTEADIMQMAQSAGIPEEQVRMIAMHLTQRSMSEMVTSAIHLGDVPKEVFQALHDFAGTLDDEGLREEVTSVLLVMEESAGKIRALALPQIRKAQSDAEQRMAMEVSASERDIDPMGLLG